MLVLSVDLIGFSVPRPGLALLPLLISHLENGKTIKTILIPSGGVKINLNMNGKSVHVLN